jgi:uncharacterized membrane protein
MRYLIIFLVIAFIGLLNSGYLFLSHYRHKKIACPIGGKCNEVTESKYSKTFGIRNDFMGILYYLFVIIVGIFIYNGFREIKIIFIIIEGLALLFSIYLIYVQAFVLRSYCFYCIVSAVINLILFTMSFWI